MILGKKVRIKPTPEQEEQLWRSAGTARWTCNWTLARQEENYRNGGKFIPDGELREELTKLTQTGGYAWLYHVSNNEVEKPTLTPEVIGVDVGIKELAVCSNGMTFRNINKTKAVKKAEKRLRRLQRQVSRKYEMNKEG